MILESLTSAIFVVVQLEALTWGLSRGPDEGAECQACPHELLILLPPSREGCSPGGQQPFLGVSLVSGPSHPAPTPWRTVPLSRSRCHKNSLNSGGFSQPWISRPFLKCMCQTLPNPFTYNNLVNPKGNSIDGLDISIITLISL